MLSLWLGTVVSSCGGPSRGEVEVMMFAVPEAVWLAKFEGQLKEHPMLWKQLDEEARAGRVERPVEMKCKLAGDEPFEKRVGGEKEFVESWRKDGAAKEVKQDRVTRRFIGTVIRLQLQSDMREDAPLRVTMKLEHHIAPPVMRRINYANAATGAERERLSVEYPQFEKIEWNGVISVRHEWRLVTQLLRPQGDGGNAMRYLVFIKRP